MDKTNIIEAVNLTKIYGKNELAFKALDDINLQIKKGESIAIVGKSGSGKSTLMHLLALLDKPTKGSILINSTDSDKLSVSGIEKLRNKTFGFVFQQFFLNSSDSVLNNVLLPLKIGKVSSRERKRRALAALASVELSDKVNSKALNLSGGQKQRVCIARALVNQPKIIFADEPTGNLDSQTGKNVMDLLFKLNRDSGITLIIVTHDSDLAKRCQKQIYIKDGKLTKEKIL